MDLMSELTDRQCCQNFFSSRNNWRLSNNNNFTLKQSIIPNYKRSRFFKILIWTYIHSLSDRYIIYMYMITWILFCITVSYKNIPDRIPIKSLFPSFYVVYNQSSK